MGDLPSDSEQNSEVLTQSLEGLNLTSASGVGAHERILGLENSNAWALHPANEESMQRFQRHSAMMLDSLNSLRRDGVLCDVTLIAEGQRFEAHRVVLVSCSDYFRSMFTSGMKETTQREIELKSLTAKGLEKVLDVVYTANATLEGDDVFHVIAAANHLQVPSVIDFCERNFLSGINSTNVMDFWATARLYGMRHAMVEIERFIAENLVAVSNEEAFAQLTQTQLLAAIRSPHCRAREIDLFRVLRSWLNALAQGCSEELEVAPTAVALLQEVRYSLISPTELVRTVQAEPLVMEHSALRDLLLQALNYHVIPHRQPLMPQAQASHIRCYKRRLVLVGGREVAAHTATPGFERQSAAGLGHTATGHRQEDPQGHSEALLVLCVPRRSPHSPSCSPDLRCAVHLQPHVQTPDSPLLTRPVSTLPNSWSHGQVVVLSNFLYVVGGCTTPCSHGESATAQMWRYDPRLDVWIQCRSMSHARAYFVATELQQRIICVGGRSREGALASCESYNPETDEWEEVASLSAPFHGHAGAVCSGQLYVSGGYSNGNFYPDLQRYDPQNGRWSDLPAMLTARGWHSMCHSVSTGMLYVLGGCSLNANSQALAVLQCEQFDPRTMQWSVIRPMPHSHREAACWVLDEEGVIYVLGGYNTLARSAQRNVSCYHLASGEWTTVPGGLQRGVSGGACVTLLLPASLPHYDDY